MDFYISVGATFKIKYIYVCDYLFILIIFQIYRGIFWGFIVYNFFAII